MSLHAKGRRLLASAIKAIADLRESLARPAPTAPIFDLQPLEKRLFLSVSATPTISASPTTITTGDSVTLSMTSHDDDGEGIDHWAVSWGDGDDENYSGDPGSVSHTYISAGNYTIGASVTENVTYSTGGDSGESGGDPPVETGGGGTYPVESTVGITVNDPEGGGGGGDDSYPPDVSLSGGSSVTEGTSYSLSISTSQDSSDTDSDPISSISINWGDGHTDTHDLSEFDPIPNPLNVSHTYTTEGSYTINTSATDDDSETGTQGKGVTVVPAAPIPAISGKYQVQAGTTYTLGLANNASFSRIDSWLITWGDGSAPQTVSGNPSSVTHVFTLPSTTYLITATAVQDGANYSGNVLPVVVRLGTPSDPPATNVVVNFQPNHDGANASVHFLSGTVSDIGQVFTDQANFSDSPTDYCYGWSAAAGNTYYTTAGNAATAPDYRYQTYTEMSATAVWAIGLAPGTYSVKIVAGKPNFSSGDKYSILANGTSVVSYSPTGTSWYTTGTQTITVGSDGRLTLTTGSDAVHNVINFIEITPTAHLSFAPSAPSGLTVAAEAKAGSNVPINLTWSDGSDNDTGFKVYRSTDNSTFTLVQTTPTNVTYWSDSVSANTTYYYKVAATNSHGDSSYTTTKSIYTGGLDVTDAAYGGVAWPVPGTIQAEDFDIGTGGSHDVDSTTLNVGGIYRNNTIDVGDGGPYDGGHMVGWTAAGEWMSYTISVGTAGNYCLDVAVACAGQGGTFHLKLDNTDVPGSTFTVPDTGGWDNFQTISLENLSLPANTHVLTVYLDDGGPSNAIGNFDYLKFTAMSSAAPSAPVNLYASPAAAAQISLSWSSTSSYASSFLVKRSGDGTTFTTLATLGPTTTTYTDITASANTAYVYQVCAKNSKGTSAPSNTVLIKTGGSTDAKLGAALDAYEASSWNGTSAQLDVKQGADTAYFQFGTSGVTGTISGATLWIFGAESATTHFGVSATVSGLTNNSWGEGSGGPPTGGPPAGTPTLPVTNTLNLSTGRWYQFDVSTFVLQQLAASHTTITLVLDSLVGTNNVWLFNSKQASVAKPVLMLSRSSAPSAPTLNTISAASSTQLNLSWSISGSASGVYIERSTDDSSFTQIADVTPSSTTTFHDTSLNPGTIYYYRVRAHNSTYGETAYSSVQAKAPNSADPTGLPAAVPSNNEIDLSWINGAGVQDGIRVQRSTDGSTFTTIASIPGYETTYVDLSLSENTTYYYRIYAYGTGANSSYISVTATTPGDVAGAPTLADPARNTSTPTTAIDLSWTAGSGTTSGYAIERSLDGTHFSQITTQSGSFTTYSDTGLASATVYYYRVRASNAGGYSPYSSVKSISTATAAPMGFLAVQAGTTQINLFWANGGDESGVYVERSSDNITYTQITDLIGTPTTYHNTGLTPSTLYYYRIKAHSSGPDSQYTSYFSATTLTDKPTALSVVTISTNEIDLAWTNGSGARTNNYVERSTNPLNWSSPTVFTLGPASTSYPDTSVSAGTSYFYRVRSSGPGGYSAYTTAKGSFSAISAPITLTASRDSTNPDSKVDLFWTDGGGSFAGVYIERSTDNSTFTTVGQVLAPGITYQDTGRSSNTSYFYKVMAYGAAGSIEDSTPASVTTAPIAPMGLTAASATGTEIDLAWTDGDSNQSGIYVERSTSSTSGFTQIASLSGTPATYQDQDTTISAGTTYYYRVRAYGSGSGNNSGFTAVASAVSNPAAPSAPSSLSVTALSSSEASLTWTNGSGVQTGAYIERSIDNTTFTRVADLSGTPVSDLDTGLAPGTTYYYRVKSYGPGGTSTASSAAFAVTGATIGSTSSSTSGISVAGVTENIVMLVWNPPASLSGIANYRVQRGGTTIATTPVAMLIDTGLSPATSYTYTVTALDSGGGTLSFSGSASVTTTSAPVFALAGPAAPGTPSGAVNTSAAPFVTLSWSAPGSHTGAITYEILRDGVSVGGGAATTFIDTDVDLGTTYTYAIQTTDATGKTSTSSADITISGTDHVAPDAPRDLVSSATTSSSITLSWLGASDNVGVAGYKVSTDGGITWGSLITATTYTDSSGVSAGTYHFMVKAVDAAGNSSTPNPSTTVIVSPPAIDTASDQYIPDDFQDLFYTVAERIKPRHF